jgi:hypothetical protein
MFWWQIADRRQGAEVSPKERAIKKKNIIMIRMMVIARQEIPRLILAIAICQLAGALGSVFTSSSVSPGIRH